jgi:ABC-type transporter Mla subunit MlaD
MSTSTAPDANDHDRALVKLCAQVLPVWARQLASSRSQSETAVAEMLGAFAEIGPHLDMATRQSGQITAALAQGSDGITGLAQACENELRPLVAGLDAPTAAAIERVMQLINAAVDALERISKPFERETQLVGQQVERMYRGFQYQDRISQMMSLLHEDIERLEKALADSKVDVDATAWLARLESQYVMTEQRHQHGEPGGDPAADDEETTFF